MRYLVVLILAFSLMLTSCSEVNGQERLAYQQSKLYVEAEFTFGDESIQAILELEAPEFDSDGRMLARNAVLSFSENSIISGVGFVYSGGDVYVTTGDLKIPIDNSRTTTGISEMISLFCISEDSYYSSERVTKDGIALERSVYINGDNRVEVTIDPECELPTDIYAVIDGRELSCDIKLIKAE